jgi:hypothetical protein
MRWMCWVSTAVLACSVTSGVLACDCDGHRSAPVISQPSYSVLSGEACCSPMGYGWTSGCCEYSRPCCTNAWEGYCVRKSACANSCRGGCAAPRAARHAGYCCNTPVWGGWTECCTSSSSEVIESSPNTNTIQPIPAAPTPATEKSSQRPRPVTSYVK